MIQRVVIFIGGARIRIKRFNSLWVFLYENGYILVEILRRIKFSLYSEWV